MNASEIEQELAAARRHVQQAMNALAEKQGSDEQEMYLRAIEKVLEVERKLAVAKGEEYAVTIDDFPVRWSSAAPSPHVFANDWYTLLVFFVQSAYFDKSHVGEHEAESIAVAEGSWAIVEFQNHVSVRFGTPNDEALRGHRLYGRGFLGDAAQIVNNSSWIKELEAINSVHPNHNRGGWSKVKHYIFLVQRFHV